MNIPASKIVEGLRLLIGINGDGGNGSSLVLLLHLWNGQELRARVEGLF